jgi:hypothetical protein
MHWASALARDTSGADAADRALAVLAKELPGDPSNERLRRSRTSTVLEACPSISSTMIEGG